MNHDFADEEQLKNRLKVIMSHEEHRYCVSDCRSPQNLTSNPGLDFRTVDGLQVNQSKIYYTSSGTNHKMVYSEDIYTFTDSFFKLSIMNLKADECVPWLLLNPL